MRHPREYGDSPSLGHPPRMEHPLSMELPPCMKHPPSRFTRASVKTRANIGQRVWLPAILAVDYTLRSFRIPLAIYTVSLHVTEDLEGLRVLRDSWHELLR